MHTRLALLVVAALASAACQRGKPNVQAVEPGAEAGLAAAVTDAPDAAPDAAPSGPRDRTLRAVAEVSDGDVDGVVTADGRVLLSASSVLYEAKADGEVTPAADLAEQAAFFPEDDSLVGFLPSRRALWPRGALAGPLFLDDAAGGSMLLSGGKVRSAAGSKLTGLVTFDGHLLGIAEGLRELAWADGHEAARPRVPEGRVVRALAVLGDGGLVAYAPSADKPAALSWPKGGLDAVAVEVDAGAHGEGPECSFVPSWDGGATLRCVSSAWGPGTGKTTFARWTGGRFQRAFEHAPDDVTSASVTREGTLIVARRSRPAPLRCRVGGATCDELELATDVTKPIAMAAYRIVETDVVERDPGGRAWSTIRVVSGSADEYFVGSSFVAAPTDDDVWLVSKYLSRTIVLHTGAPRDRVSLPSTVDARVLVRNARPPAPWTGHCDQLFVRIESGKPEALAMTKEAAKARLAEIKKALAVPSTDADDGYWSAPFGWALVEGRLADEHVLGVVVHRNDVEAPLDAMERATSRLVDKLAKNPMSRPDVFCTLPVLDRRIGP